MDKLLGQADPGSHGMKNMDGIQVEPSLAIFPICIHKDGGRIAPIGTGFFVDASGIFITAAHVLFNEEGQKAAEAFSIIQFLEGGGYVVRPIARANRKYDVAIGVVTPMEGPSGALRAKVIQVSTEARKVGDRICTFAFPKGEAEGGEIRLRADFFGGQIIDCFPEGRPLLPGPSYCTSMALHGGASGGPVMGPDGTAFAVNSMGYDGIYDTSFVSPIESAMDLTLDDIQGDTETSPRAWTVREILSRKAK